MSRDDLKTIEKELGIKLPRHYVDFILNFKGFVSSEYDVERFLYSTPEALIFWNQTLGLHLPNNTTEFKGKLIVGDNGGGDYYLIDLLNPDDRRVCGTDHEDGTLTYFDDLKAYEDETREGFGL